MQGNIPHHGFIGLLSSDGTMLSFYRVTDLWEASNYLPVHMLPVETLTHFLDEQPHWCEGTPRRSGSMPRRANAVLTLTLAYPIILSEEGHLLDGRHRLGKAWVLGLRTIAVVCFQQNPVPYRRCHPDELVTTH